MTVSFSARDAATSTPCVSIVMLAVLVLPDVLLMVPTERSGCGDPVVLSMLGRRQSSAALRLKFALSASATSAPIHAQGPPGSQYDTTTGVASAPSIATGTGHS